MPATSLLVGHENDNETKLTEKLPHSKYSSEESHNDIPLTGYCTAIKMQLWKQCTVVVETYDEILNFKE